MKLQDLDLSGLVEYAFELLSEGKVYPLQYSCLENSMDCVVHGIAKSRTGLSDFHFHFPVVLPGEFHEQRSLVDYSPQGCKESERTALLTLPLFTTHRLFFNHLNSLLFLHFPLAHNIYYLSFFLSFKEDNKIICSKVHPKLRTQQIYFKKQFEFFLNLLFLSMLYNYIT